MFRKMRAPERGGIVGQLIEEKTKAEQTESFEAGRGEPTSLFKERLKGREVSREILGEGIERRIIRRIIDKKSGIAQERAEIVQEGGVVQVTITSYDVETGEVSYFRRETGDGKPLRIMEVFGEERISVIDYDPELSEREEDWTERQIIDKETGRILEKRSREYQKAYRDPNTGELSLEQTDGNLEVFVKSEIMEKYNERGEVVTHEEQAKKYDKQGRIIWESTVQQSKDMSSVSEVEHNYDAEIEGVARVSRGTEKVYFRSEIPEDKVPDKIKRFEENSDEAGKVLTRRTRTIEYRRITVQEEDCQADGGLMKWIKKIEQRAKDALAGGKDPEFEFVKLLDRNPLTGLYDRAEVKSKKSGPVVLERYEYDAQGRQIKREEKEIGGRSKVIEYQYTSKKDSSPDRVRVVGKDGQERIYRPCQEGEKSSFRVGNRRYTLAEEE